MRLLDASRRLTGPNLQTRRPSVVSEVAWDENEKPEEAIALWKEEIRRLHELLGWPLEECVARQWSTGAALVVSAPSDLLLDAVDLNDLAVRRAAARLTNAEPPDPEELLASLRARPRNPALLKLREEARRRRVPCLVDDETLTLGHAAFSRSWPLNALPEEVCWEDFGSIPVALLTGTNGKTTSARLVARMARHAGLIAGNTSTDGVYVDGEAIERGDWTGPAAALRVLRHEEVQLAVLETARGGILRRGLAVESCEAALITNVSADHLGDYGVEDVRAMAEVKAVVASVARTVVLNADDPELLRLAPTLAARVVLFSLDADSEALEAHRAQGGETWGVREGLLVRERAGEKTQAFAPVHEIPLSFGGAALYNVSNALGASALASALGLPDEAIRQGLLGFTSSEADNPGRGNLHDFHGVKVVVDFGHNPAAVKGVLGLARSLASDRRLYVCVGLPGDRRDGELKEVVEEIARARPHRVYVRELHGYERGREKGEIPALIEGVLIESGHPSEGIVPAENELHSLHLALEAAEPGEVVLVLVHLEPEVQRFLQGGMEA